MSSPMLTFRGVRGSMPVSGHDTNRHGGHTLCADVADGTSSLVLIDGGTGITHLNNEDSLAAVSDFHVFLTHYHWDHIQGLLFFTPLFDAGNTFTFYGHVWDGMDVQEAIEGALRPPWFPVSLHDTAARKHFVTVGNTPVAIGRVRITAAPLRHPQGVTAYRLDGPTASIVIATDCESGDTAADRTLRDLAHGVDVLVHDAQYSPDEYEDHFVGWGHSTWAHAAQVARDVGAGELILLSHDPARSDDEIDRLVTHAQKAFPKTRAAFEGMQLQL